MFFLSFLWKQKKSKLFMQGWSKSLRNILTNIPRLPLSFRSWSKHPLKFCLFILCRACLVISDFLNLSYLNLGTAGHLEMHLFLLTFILLGISSGQIMAEGEGFCSTTVQCIDKVKKIVPETDRFWFGDQYKLQCGEFSTRKIRMVILIFKIF